MKFYIRRSKAGSAFFKVDNINIRFRRVQIVIKSIIYNMGMEVSPKEIFRQQKDHKVYGRIRHTFNVSNGDLWLDNHKGVVRPEIVHKMHGIILDDMRIRVSLKQVLMPEILEKKPWMGSAYKKLP